jgi:hypothetical protein
MGALRLEQGRDVSAASTTCTAGIDTGRDELHDPTSMLSSSAMKLLLRLTVG